MRVQLYLNRWEEASGYSDEGLVTSCTSPCGDVTNEPSQYNHFASGMAEISKVAVP